MHDNLDWLHDDSVRIHAAQWYDEDNCIAELEFVKIIRMGAKDIFIGKDPNIELELEELEQP